MNTRWMRVLAGCLLLALVAESVFAGPSEGPRSLRAIEPGRLVHVTMTTHEGFDAIWIGRQGDRGIFQRLDPDETIGVRLDALLDVRALRARSANMAAWRSVGLLAGLFAVPIVVGIFARD
jgi:hypothetical protein